MRTARWCLYGLIAAILATGGCSHQSPPPSQRQADANSPAGKVGKAAHAVAVQSGKAAAVAARELGKAARQAREGWKEAAREDKEKKK